MVLGIFFVMAKKGKYTTTNELNSFGSIVNKCKQHSIIKESTISNTRSNYVNMASKNKSEVLSKPKSLSKSKSESDKNLEEENIETTFTISNASELCDKDLDIQLEINVQSDSKASIGSENQLEQNLPTDNEIYQKMFKENIETIKKTKQHRYKSLKKRLSDKYGQLNDVCCLAVFCVRHQYLALIRSTNKILYLPHLFLNINNQSVNKIVKELLAKLFANINVKYTNFQLSTERIQIQSKMKKFINRFTYRISVEYNKENKSAKYQMKCICQTKTLVPLNWCSYQDICQMLSNINLPMVHGPCSLFGPEPKFIFDYLLSNNPNTEYSAWTEVSTFDDCENNNIFYIWNVKYDNHQRILQVDGPKAIPQISDEEKRKLCCLHMEKNEINSLYNEFTLQCFPSLFMTFYSFKCLLDKLILTQQIVLPFNEQRQYQYFK